MEVEWAKFTRFFFSEIGPFKKKVPHLMDLKRRVVHVDARFKGETPSSSKSDIDRQTDKLTTVTLSRMRAEG